jgi:hypothetical protein
MYPQCNNNKDKDKFTTAKMALVWVKEFSMK